MVNLEDGCRVHLKFLPLSTLAACVGARSICIWLSVAASALRLRSNVSFHHWWLFSRVYLFFQESGLSSAGVLVKESLTHQ